MIIRSHRVASVVLGATTGGAFVGGAEAAYRAVDIVPIALAYATVCALAALAIGAAVTALLERAAPNLSTLFVMALGAAIAPGIGVLTTFVARRDFLGEAPGSTALAGYLGAGAAVFTCVLFWVLWRSRALSHLARPPVGALWLPVLLVAGAFAAQVIRNPVGGGVVKSAVEPKQLVGQGVILVLADALRSDALGTYGASAHRGKPASPVVDALGGRGLVFENVSAQASWTKPAMASVLTSLHARNHMTMSKTARLPSDIPTLATVLRGHRIKTAAVVGNYNLSPRYHFNRDFDTYEYLAPDRYLGAPEGANRIILYNVYRLLRERLLPQNRRPEHFYQLGTRVTDRGLALLDEIGNDTFFMWLHYMEPHDPYFSVDGKSYARVEDPHPPLAAADAMLAAYRDDVHRFDDALGELVTGLQKRGLTDRVTIIVLSDHGEEFGEHGGFFHGTTLYEEQLQVPLVISGAAVPVGRRQDLARQIDVAPTVAKLLNVEPSPSWEGRDLLSDSEPPAFAVAEEDHQGNQLESIRDGRLGGQKLILANAGNPRGLMPVELYDLGADPGEATKLAQPTLIERLRNQFTNAVPDRSAQRPPVAVEHLDVEAEAELKALGYIE